MLGHTYRYQVQNGTGVSVTCTVTERAFKFASDGNLTFAAESVRINAVSVATTAFSNSSTVDNSTDKNLGSDVSVNFAPASSATGTCTLFLQRSTDGGTTWPSDGQGIPLAGVTFSASATAVRRNAQVR